MFYTTITMIIVTIVINSCIFVERERERKTCDLCVYMYFALSNPSNLIDSSPASFAHMPRGLFQGPF